MSKKVLITLTVIIVIINVVTILDWSILSRDEENYEIKMTDKMIQHLYEKYGEFDYEIIEFNEPFWGWGGFYEEAYDYDTLELEVVVNDIERTIIVERREKKLGYEFYDNYFAYIIQDELENYIKEMADKHFEKNKVSCCFERRSFFPENLTKDSDVNDLLKEEKKDCNLYVYIYSDTDGQTIDEFENIIHTFIKEYEEMGIATDISVYGCEGKIIDAAQDEEISEENIKYTYEYEINKK